MLHLLNGINKYCNLTYTTIMTYVSKLVSSFIHNDYEIEHANTYKYIFLQILLFYVLIDTKINFIKNLLYKWFAYIVCDHTINIVYFNIVTNETITYMPLLYFLKYFTIPSQPHEVYFSITMWSSKKSAYVSIFIDGILLHRLRNIYPDNPYTVSHIVDLLKYSNTIDYIDIIHTKKKYIANNANNANNAIDKNKLQPYLRSFAIPNNVTLRAFEFLYAYLQNDYMTYDNLKFLIPYNYVVKHYNMEVIVVHNNMYKIRFTDPNDIIYSSLNVNVCD